MVRLTLCPYLFGMLIRACDHICGGFVGFTSIAEGFSLAAVLLYVLARAVGEVPMQGLDADTKSGLGLISYTTHTKGWKTTAVPFVHSDTARGNRSFPEPVGVTIACCTRVSKHEGAHAQTHRCTPLS